MKPEQQIKALAELDGYEYRKSTSTYQMDGWFNREGNGPFAESFLSYTYGKCRVSYDAIIPLVQKQDRPTQIRMMKLVAKLFGEEIGWGATPTQLSEALLRSTNKWTK